MDEQLLGMTGIGLTGPDQMLIQEQQAQAMEQQQDNPFNSPQYQNISTPDVPVSYGGGMADILLNKKVSYYDKIANNYSYLSFHNFHLFFTCGLTFT